MEKKKRIHVFLTGATGHMGFEALKFLISNPRIYLKVLILPRKGDLKIVRDYQHRENLEIIQGDLRNINDVRRGVSGSDYVLHVGALIPPAADRHPESALAINLGGTLNILQAIKEQDNPDHIRLVYISTVASMGFRPPPFHWARTGDPIKVSHFDSYAVSKVKAERAVIESGLRYWVCLRQSGMLHKDLFKLMDPILFHQPLDNHIEWSTARDSGRALYKICTLNLPGRFWRNTYNIGGGEEFRVTYYEFLSSVYSQVGVHDIRKILSPREFASRNFHCVWYKDSDVLDDWLGYRKSTYKEFLSGLIIPWYCKILKILPSWFIKRLIMEPLAKKKEGTLHWIKRNVIDRIEAFWGSRENWESLPGDWENFRLERDAASLSVSHGYDESLPDSKINLGQCRAAAFYRGGRVLSKRMKKGELYTPLMWECSCGNSFSASPYLVLKAGHWCPLCDTDTAVYKKQAESNPFFAQVYL